MKCQHKINYEICCLKNYHWDEPEEGKPIIKITVDDPEWETAYKNWIEGKNPTDSLKWGRTVVADYRSTWYKKCWWCKLKRWIKHQWICTGK